MMKVPEIYNKVIERMYMKSFKGKLPTGKARHILGTSFHINKQQVFIILKEMQSFKLIEIPKNSGGRYIIILWNPPRNSENDVT